MKVCWAVYVGDSLVACFESSEPAEHFVKTNYAGISCTVKRCEWYPQ